MYHTGNFNKIPIRKRPSKNENNATASKLSKTNLPENYQPRNDPLYSLPKELLDLSFIGNSKRSGAIAKKRNSKRREKRM